MTFAGGRDLWLPRLRDLPHRLCDLCAESEPRCTGFSGSGHWLTGWSWVTAMPSGSGFESG
jgi:hypothetical protein